MQACNMWGDILNAFVETIRSAPFIKDYDLNVCIVRNDGRDVVNTTIPCVAISMQDNPDPRVFIGGLIEDIIDVQLSIIVDYDNMSLSKDNGFQVKMLNLPHKIRNYIEQNKQGQYFQDLIDKYEFFPLYDGFRTYQTVASMKSMEKSVFVYEIRYKCRVVDKELHNDMNPVQQLEEILLTDSTDGRVDRTTSITQQYYSDY